MSGRGGHRGNKRQAGRGRGGPWYQRGSQLVGARPTIVRLSLRDNVTTWPERMRMTMRYSLATTVASIASVAGTFLRANSIFDPEFSLGGGQPQGFDQMVLLYSKWVVVNAECRVLAFSNAAAGRANVYLAPVTSSSVSVSTPAGVAEFPGGRSALCSFSGGPARLANTSTTAAVIGVPAAVVMAEDTFWGTSSANPAAEGTWFWALAQDTTGATDTVGYQIDMYFDVVWFKRQDPTDTFRSPSRSIGQPISFISRPTAAWAACPVVSQSHVSGCLCDRCLQRL